MHQYIIDSSIASTKNCFELMLGVCPENSAPRRILNEPMPNSDISAVIGMTGTLSGWIAVRFDKAAATGLMSLMLGEPKSELDPDVQDACGEIVNIIAGGMKSTLADNGNEVKIAIPSIFVGHNHELSIQAHSEYYTVNFTTDIGQFSVDFCFAT